MSDMATAVSAPPERARACLAQLFGTVPPGAEDAMAPRRMRAGETLTRVQDKASNVYVLLEGRVKVLDERYSGDVYAFAEFEAPCLFGEFEAFAGCGRYRATLVCATDCSLLSLPAAFFLDWMRRDPAALFERTRQITRRLIDQARDERRFRFAPALDRLALYLAEAYRRWGGDGTFLLDLTRQEMADDTGYCVKTIQRCLAALRGQGLISTRRAKISIDGGQFRGLAALAAEGLDPDGGAAGK